ncbi:MAG: PD-(D/E)XK nuclease family protein [Legionella sp.]
MSLAISTFNDKERLFFLLDHETTVLTPNNRLSESLLQDYFVHCQNQTVDKPKCMPYRVALVKAYEYLHFTQPHNQLPTLLSDAQCQHLWRKIIQSESRITCSDGLLQSVMSAWERCQQWQIHPEDPTFHYTDQTKQFQQWWRLFEKQLAQQQLITQYQLVPFLVNANSYLFSQPIVWVCFDDFTPQQLLLQEHLTHQGLSQYHYDLKENSSKTEVFAAQNTHEEYQQLMAWLHAKIQQGEQRLGVVVPNLEHESASLQRALAHHFDRPFFNISLGQSLSSFPLIAHALCWLNLDEYLTPHQTNLLLQSPYLGAAKEEFLARSDYLQESTLLEQSIIPLSTLIKELHKKTPKLEKLLSKITPYPQTASVHEWISCFKERLNTVGFPGDYSLNSENYQCLNRFIMLFDELRQFTLISDRLTQDDAFEVVHQLANNTIFQAQKNNAPIQVSGLLEASGCEFDSLWVMGLTDQCLPQKINLSAFIPPQLQRNLRMPHSLPERELHFAHQTIQRLQHSARTIVFSYTKLQGDSLNLPCSLITQYPNFTPFLINYDRMQNSDLMTMDESFNIPLLPEESIAGGTAILANQANCPFKAFAEHRLRAKTSPQMTDGLNNKERGQIIHKVMELLWNTLRSQHDLLQLAPHALEQHINEAIHTALASIKHQPQNAILEVESIRLKRLVHACLEWEKQRPPFTITALEQSYSVHLAGLDFQVRIDRLDQIENKKWVIDYKSSLPASKPWNEDRPKEPQLLLYALLDEQINTLLFLQLKAGKISCAGISEEKHTIYGITALKKEETWTGRRDTWQQQLTELASEFQQGHCPPQPVHLSICQQCDFQNLCRFQAEG